MVTHKQIDIVHIKYNGQGYEVQNFINRENLLCTNAKEALIVARDSMDVFYGNWLKGRYDEKGNDGNT